MAYTLKVSYLNTLFSRFFPDPEMKVIKHSLHTMPGLLLLNHNWIFIKLK